MYFRNYLPLEKDGSLHLNPLHPRMLCAMFGWSNGSGEEDVESLRQIRRRQRTTDKLQTPTMDNGQIAIRKAHLSFVCFLFLGVGVLIVPLENYSHIWRRHHFR